MLSQPRVLVVDSRQALTSAPYDSFRLQVEPPIVGLKGVRLIYANIGNPVVAPAASFWLLRVSEFGSPIRGSTDGSDSCTFIVPVNSAQGYRTIHRAETDFSHVAIQQPASDIHELTVRLMLPGGGQPLIADPWYFILELQY